MKKQALIGLVASGMVLLAHHGAYAQLRNPFGDGLEGTYSFQTNGTAMITAPTEGTCTATNGVGIDAGLTNGEIRLDGHGNIVGSNVGISIGATSCTSPNYGLSGTYTIQKTGDGTIEATGFLTTKFQGRPAGCAVTTLTSQPFTLIATTSVPMRTSFKIETSGAGDGSTYGEGNSNGSATVCAGATIVNFVTSGTGDKIGN